MDFSGKVAISTGAASGMGQFINGETIMIDGGRNAALREC